jgi:uncharacterized protein
MLRAFRLGLFVSVALFGARFGYAQDAKPAQPSASGATSVEAPKPDHMTPMVMPRSVQFDMTSKFSGRTYRVFVRRPLAPPPPGGYPVVMVTDGEGIFPIAAAGAALHELRGDKPALVVGVGYPTTDPSQWLTLRNRDLTPTPPATDGSMPSAPGQPPMKAEDTGGAEAFYRFLTEELRPALAANYPVNNQDQALYGHSLGGLFALGVLFKHPEAFHTYLISSPSIWWNHKVVLKDEAAFAHRIEAREVSPRVLVLVGAQEQSPPQHPVPGMSVAEMEKILAASLMVDNARALGERLAALHGAPGYTVRSHVFEEEDHLSVVPASVGRFLTFALEP